MRQLINVKTTFSLKEWLYTMSDENLFDLSKEELYTYRLIVKGAP